MPELPEVETVRSVLSPQLCGRRIRQITLLQPQVIAWPQPDAFLRAVGGQTIAALERRGKFLIFRLADGARMLLHLRMTGSLYIAPDAEPVEKHTHVLFRLSDDEQLRFCDPRRFGRFWYFAAGEADTRSGVAQLGPEPFDEAMNAAYLSSCLSRSRRSVKACLLDQRIVAGIGNIYADETLFAARIHPATPACSLTAAQGRALAAQIPQTLRFAIEKNRISAEDYARAHGDDYRNTPFLSVYARDGQPCPRCGETLRRCIVCGRGTVYCPVCQPAP